MTDEMAGDAVRSSDEASRPARRPTPAATAASRARRIGGASRRPGAPDAPGAENLASGPSLTKPERPAGEPGDRPAQPQTRPAGPSERRAAEVPGWLRWLPAGALTAGALAVAVFLAVASHGVWWGRPSANAVRDQVLAAAKSCTAAANSYSYRTFAADEAKGLACTTGAQTARYRHAMEQGIKSEAFKLKATQTAQVNAAGVSQVSQDGSQWTILVFGQLTIHASQTSSKGRVDPFAAVVRMDHVGESWLISSINTVSAPGA